MKYLPVLLILLACRPQDNRTETNEKSRAIQQLVHQYHQTGEFDGSVLVADSTGIIYKGAFGLADRKNNIQLETTTLFYLASVSKQFTASAVLLLMQDGLLQPEDPVNKFIPELPGIYEDISIRHLLNHTSGIPDYYEFANPNEGFTNNDVLNILTGIDSLEFNPGEKYKYSNSGYVLLSILVDRISGKTFAQYLNEKAFMPAGMKSTFVLDEEAPGLENRAIGYGRDSTITDYKFRTTGGGGIFSNVEDLYRWHLALLSGKILNRELQELAREPAILKNDSTVYYGFGWNIDPSDPDHIFHSGELEGFRTWFDRNIRDQTIIVILSNNSCDSLKQISCKLLDIIGQNNHYKN